MPASKRRRVSTEDSDGADYSPAASVNKRKRVSGRQRDGDSATATDEESEEIVKPKGKRGASKGDKTKAAARKKNGKSLTAASSQSSVNSPARSKSSSNLLSPSKARLSNVDPSSEETNWKLRMLDGLVWVCLPLKQHFETRSAESSENAKKLRKITGQEGKGGFWWPAEIRLAKGSAYATEPVELDLFVDTEREVLRFWITVEHATKDNLLSLRKISQVRVHTGNFHQEIESEESAENGQQVFTGPSPEAFTSARTYALQRDADIEGLPDIEQASQQTPGNSSMTSPKKAQYYNPPAYLETEDDVDLRLTFPEPVLANWPNPGTKKPTYYPALITGFNLPAPLTGTEEDQKRKPASYKISYCVQWPAGFKNDRPRISRDDFALTTDNDFYDLSLGVVQSNWLNTPQQILERVLDFLPTMQQVIEGKYEPLSVRYAEYMDATSQTRHRLSTEPVSTGEYSPDHLQAVLDFTHKWVQSDRLENNPTPTRNSGSEAFEELNKTDREHFASAILAPLAFELLVLDDEPELLEAAKQQHPEDEVEQLRVAHEKAADLLSAANWFAQINGLLRSHALHKAKA